MVKLNGEDVYTKLNKKGQKLSKTKKLHIHGNISDAEAAIVARHFGVSEVSRIQAGHINDLKRALTAAVKTCGVMLFQKGMHFLGVLNLPDHEWYTFEKKDDGQIVICCKTPGNHDLPEVARIMTVATTST